MSNDEWHDLAKLRSDRRKAARVSLNVQTYRKIQADARRYQWLKNNGDLDNWCSDGRFRSLIDEQIDEAMAIPRMEQKRVERACGRCGKQQLHWERLFHPSGRGRLQMLLVNRKGTVHECNPKFKPIIKRK